MRRGLPCRHAPRPAALLPLFSQFLFCPCFVCAGFTPRDYAYCGLIAAHSFQVCYAAFSCSAAATLLLLLCCCFCSWQLPWAVG